MTTKLTGWGNTAPTAAHVHRIGTHAELVECLAGAHPRGVIARGLGRSYGDSAQNAGGSVLDLTSLDRVDVEAATGQVTAQAGASLARVAARAVPHGFFLPVTPGTQYVTIGGAIAADVHGKNHYRDGSFGRHVTRLRLVTGASAVLDLTPHGPSADAFWSTVGGMGLTGVVTEASLQLIPIETACMLVETERFDGLDALMEAMDWGTRDFQYSVAWLDGLSRRGRGVLTQANHAGIGDLPAAEARNPLAFRSSSRFRVPRFAPPGVFNAHSVRLFNQAYFSRAPRARETSLQALAQFFYPLDALAHWNRLYGRWGFVQYQFVVPDAAAHLVRQALLDLRAAGAVSCLAVLKRLGAQNPAPLSFPQPGWSLAVDVPASTPGLAAVLDSLDNLVTHAGGRVYLAKDARMDPAAFARSYPRWRDWVAVRNELDPPRRFVSDQARRLDLFREAP